MSDTLSKEAATLYYNCKDKYVDLIELAVSLRLTPNETDKAVKELEVLELIQTKTSIRKKK
jgi:hypothetical protein